MIFAAMSFRIGTNSAPPALVALRAAVATQLISLTTSLVFGVGAANDSCKIQNIQLLLTTHQQQRQIV